MAARSYQPAGTSITSPTFIDSSPNRVWDLSILHPAAWDHLTNKLLIPRSLSQGQLLEEPEHTPPLLVCVLVIQACLTLWDPMECSPSGSSVHGILQARILEWAAIPFSRGSPDPGMEPATPSLAGRFFITEPPGKPTIPYMEALISKEVSKE